MNSVFNTLLSKFKNTPTSLYITYVAVYLPLGIIMNSIGIYAEIAKFTFWWQIITCYVLYMIPISILLKDKPFFKQYAYGLVAMGLLEFSGYALQTSYAFPNNMLDQIFGVRNFALVMALFFALYFPVGNKIVSYLHTIVFQKK